MKTLLAILSVALLTTSAFAGYGLDAFSYLKNDDNIAFTKDPDAQVSATVFAYDQKTDSFYVYQPDAKKPKSGKVGETYPAKAITKISFTPHLALVSHGGKKTQFVKVSSYAKGVFTGTEELKGAPVEIKRKDVLSIVFYDVDEKVFVNNKVQPVKRRPTKLSGNEQWFAQIAEIATTALGQPVRQEEWNQKMLYSLGTCTGFECRSASGRHATIFISIAFLEKGEIFSLGWESLGILSGYNLEEGFTGVNVANGGKPIDVKLTFEDMCKKGWTQLHLYKMPEDKKD